MATTPLSIVATMLLMYSFARTTRAYSCAFLTATAGLVGERHQEVEVLR